MKLNAERVKSFADLLMHQCLDADITTPEVAAALAMAVCYVEKSTGLEQKIFDALLRDTRQKSNPEKN